MGKHYIPLIALLLLIAPSLVQPASAGNQKGFSVSPLIGGITFDGRQDLDTSPVFGVHLGYNFTGSLGMEALFAYTETVAGHTTETVKMQRYGGELLYHFVPDNKFVPYLAAGYSGIQMDGKSSFANTSHIKGSPSYGLGAKYLVTDDVAWRVDVRHMLYHYDRAYHAVEYTIGLYIPFGGAPRVEKLADPPAVTGSPGVYVHVIDGEISLSNQAGSQSVATGQFGYSSGSNQAPIILLKNPDIPFASPTEFPLEKALEKNGVDKPVKSQPQTDK